MIISEFKGEYFYLSNFSQHSITYNGIIFATVEHFFQACKTLDKMEQQQIILAPKPKDAKDLGAIATLRPDWEDVKLKLLQWAIFLKFTQNIRINKQLLATGDDILIEGNYWHDCEYGNCTCSRCIDIEGQNKLGKILMFTRFKLRNG